MEKILFGVFAHPDDEAMGPSGTLIKRVKGGEKLHLICVTRGQAGMNPDGHADLGEVREREWRAAGKRIGAMAMHCLNYQDGMLSNKDFHDIADEIERIVKEVCDASDQPTELNFVTLDLNGLTGHLDHILVSSVVSYVFYRLKDALPNNAAVGELDYFCLSRDQVPAPNTDYVFMPAGRDESFITRTVDVSDVLDQKIAVIREHHSQRNDAESLLGSGEQSLSKEHFHTIS